MGLREATVADTAQLHELSRRTFIESFAASNTPEDIGHYLEERLSLDQLGFELNCLTSKFAVIEEEGLLCAFAKINWGLAQTEDRQHSVELQRLYVAKNAQGKGFGKLLMEWALDQARSKAAKELWLGVWEHNHTARRFYDRYQFTEVGSHVFRLGSDDQTDLILAKPL